MAVRWQRGGPRGRRALFLALFAAVLGAHPTASGAPVVGKLPSPSPVVRRVILEGSPIFSQVDRERLPWLPLGLVNTLHVDTRAHVIQRELLFAPGQATDLESLEESERKLRQTGFFSKVGIEVRPAAGDSIDVVVHTQELWTTAVNFSYERFEDQRLWSVQVRERNFLGTARSLDVRRSVDEDRSTWSFGLGDRQLFDGTWRARFRFSDADDGEATSWRLDRPFFRVTDEWAIYSGYRHRGLSPRTYLTGSQYVRPHVDQTDLQVYALRRFAISDHTVYRAGLGFDLTHQRFATGERLEVSDARGGLGFVATLDDGLPEARRWHSPMLMVERATRRYEQTRFLFGMGNVEDIPLGLEFQVRGGYALPLLESTDNGLRLNVGASWFERTGPFFLQRASLALRGLVNDEGSQNLRLEGQVATYHTVRPWLTLAGAATAGTGSRIDRHRSFNLGLETGLRAARFRELAGDRLLRANGEARVVYTPGIYDLVTPGAAFFLDYGTAWFESETDFQWEKVRGAIGIGLRLGFNRAAADVPIRVDLAWPLLYPTDQGSPVLSIGTGHVF